MYVTTALLGIFWGLDLSEWDVTRTEVDRLAAFEALLCPGSVAVHSG